MFTPRLSQLEINLMQWSESQLQCCSACVKLMPKAKPCNQPRSVSNPPNYSISPTIQPICLTELLIESLLFFLRLILISTPPLSLGSGWSEAQPAKIFPSNLNFLWIKFYIYLLFIFVSVKSDQYLSITFISSELKPSEDAQYNLS